jgi:hypothetical protein
MSIIFYYQMSYFERILNLLKYKNSLWIITNSIKPFLHDIKIYFDTKEHWSDTNLFAKKLILHSKSTISKLYKFII